MSQKKRSTNNTNKKTNQPSGKGKVTQPLRQPRAKQTRRSGQRPNNVADNAAHQQSSKKSSWFSQILAKNNDEKQGAYTSVKNRNKKIFKQASGASPRGSVEDDKNRFRTVWVVSIIILCALLGRAYYIQVINAEFYQQKGDELITSVRTQPSYRGMITDRNNLPLAISAPLSTVYFSPYDYAREYYSIQKIIKNNPQDEKRQARMVERLQQMDLLHLATATHVPVEKLREIVAIDHNVDVNDEQAVQKVLPSGAGSHYFPLLSKVTPEIAQRVMDMDFVGVYDNSFFQRYYPQSQPNAQLLGFMGYSEQDPDSGYQGRAGIELQYESKLAGSDGKILVLKDARQNSLKVLKQIEPEIAGQDIQLTIDARLQYLLYKELEKAGRHQEARWTSGIIVDISNGEVLAMSSWPTFNSNNLNEMNGNRERNRALLDIFEPGSVMKPFTVAAALDSGRYHRRSLIDTSPGVIRVQGYNIRDHGNLGVISFDTLLQKSSNVGSTKIALSLPADGIVNMQHKFGFGKKTALDFPGEGEGLLKVPSENQKSRRATLSYGYGLQVTLAQLAQAYAALASGGVLHPLTLVKTDNPPVGSQILNQKQAYDIVEMLELVTQKGGTGVAAAIDGYRVAGKTGTSRRANPKGGYYTDQYRNIFAGIAPASNPRLVCVILLEDPRKQHYAGQTAAPVFHNVMKEALRLYNVPLDKPLKGANTQGNNN